MFLEILPSQLKKFYFWIFFILLFQAVKVHAQQLTLENEGIQIPEPESSLWLWVDTKFKKVHVMADGSELKEFADAAFGRGGVGIKHKRGDNITPQGVYTIGWINDKSSFRNFFGLTYPSVQDAENGLKQQIINQDEFQAIVKAHQEKKTPPQHTALGGLVGIHGLGAPLHRQLKHGLINWTEGCIALTNQQIDELAAYIKPGMYVVID